MQLRWIIRSEKSKVAKRLANVFNRGFWDGYYLGQKMGEWNTNMVRVPQKEKSISER